MHNISTAIGYQTHNKVSDELWKENIIEMLCTFFIFRLYLAYYIEIILHQSEFTFPAKYYNILSEFLLIEIVAIHIECSI